jgi:hypothetical protein
MQNNVSYTDTEVNRPIPTILSTLRQRQNHVDNQQPILHEPKVTKISYADTEVRGSNENPIIQEPKITKISYADTEVRGSNENPIIQEPKITKISYADTEVREPVVEKNQNYNNATKTDISYADTESR